MTITALDLFSLAMARLQESLARALDAMFFERRPVTDEQWAADWYRDPAAAWWEQETPR